MEIKKGEIFDVVKMLCNVDGINCKGNFGIDLSDHKPDSGYTYYQIHVKCRFFDLDIFKNGMSVILACRSEFNRIGSIKITKVKTPSQQKEFREKYNIK